MKIVGPFLFVLLSLFNCHSIKVNKQEAVRGIVIERMVPDLDWDREKNQIIVSNFVLYYTKIYYYKNQVLLQFSYEHRKLSFAGLNDDEKRKLADSTPYQICYYSLIYSNDKNKGWRCDSNDVRSGKVVNKDSLIAEEWIGLQQNYDMLRENHHDLVSSTKSKEGNITEEYRIRNKKDTTLTGTVILVFSNKQLTKSEYSLAKETENEKKMRIIKMVTISDARYIPPTNTYIERVELPYEVKEITITNEKELIEMFKFAETALR